MTTVKKNRWKKIRDICPYSNDLWNNKLYEEIKKWEGINVESSTIDTEVFDEVK